MPRTPMQAVCGIQCALVVSRKAREKKDADAARAERKADRAKRDALKTRKDHIKEAQAVFNAYIRERDKDMPCICCGRVKTSVDGLYAHGWDCGHYRSVGSAPHLRFDERNAHRQLVYCNRDRAGNSTDYRTGLIKRIGLEAVEALEADQTPRKWTVAELAEIKATYRAKLRQLQKEKA